ncbi:coiled-coil-helix-coiled-coil-helix domain containing 6b [Aplochiton taeniatus]
MGGNGSTARKVSFGLDEEEKVTVIKGVKLSGDVLQRMQNTQDSESPKPQAPQSESPIPPPSQKPTGPTMAEVQEELRRKFEHEQALVHEQLARLAQKEREVAAAVVQHRAPPGGLEDLTPALTMERGRTHEEQVKNKALGRQLERKERELQQISAFYKEQLELLEKKNSDHYKETTEQYDQAATKAEAHVQLRPTASVCPELQAQVLRCYQENPHQTLHCSSLAKEYMTCIHTAKKSLLINHG